MKSMAYAALGALLLLIQAPAAPLFADQTPGETVTVTGKVLGHVIAGDDNSLYEAVPSPKAEALMDQSGKRVTVTGMLLNDCTWTCLMNVTDFSVLADQNTPPPPPAPVFVPAKPVRNVLPPASAAPKEEPRPASPPEREKTPPAAAAPAAAAPMAPEPGLPSGDPAKFRAN